METNELKKLWKNVNESENIRSKEEMDLVLRSKAKKSIGYFLFFAGTSILISVSFIVFLSYAIVSHWEDAFYKANNSLLILLILFLLIDTLRSFFILRGEDPAQSLKNWLNRRIILLSKAIRKQRTWLLLPVVFILSLLAINVYLADSSLVEAITNEENLIGLIIGGITGMSVSAVVFVKIRNMHRKEIDYLKLLYQSIEQG